MNKLMLSATAAVLLSACASMGYVTDSQKISAGCASAGTAIKTLTIAHKQHPFSRAEVLAIQKSVQVLAPVCLADPQPESLEKVKMDAFEAAVLALEAKVGSL